MCAQPRPGRPLAAAALLAISMWAAPAQARCGDAVRVLPGETLSDLASRCDVHESRILDLNPGIRGSRDLRAGMVLSLEAPPAEDAAARSREAVESLFARLRSYAEEAGRSLEGAAETVSRSIEEFIQRNPDLHHRVRRLGQRLNIPGMETVEAQVSLSVRNGAPGTPVTLSAIGLPPARLVEIAGGAPDSDYHVLASALTTPDGTLQVTVLLPSWADPQRDFIFVIASPDLSLAARSARFDVVESRRVP